MPKPKHAFIIMPIGRPDLDVIYYEAIRPVLKSPEFGLDERRVDKHNEGGLLKNEILDLLEAADLVVADLTLARPNVYLEVGYALSHHRVQEGRGKCPRLILTVRADHMEGHPGYNPDGFKVHFDLAGYDIVVWEDAADLKKKLTDKVRQRLSMVRSLPQPHVEAFDKPWFETQQREAMTNESFKGWTAFHAAVVPRLEPRVGIRKMKEAAYVASDRAVRGVCLADRSSFPAQAVEDETIRTRVKGGGDYEVWSLRGDGAFFRFSAYEEDLSQRMNPGDAFWFDVRIWDFVAVIHTLERLYDAVGVAHGADVHVRASWTGLRGRRLAAGSADRSFLMRRAFGPADSHHYTKDLRFAHGAANIPTLIKPVLGDLFEMFDYQLTDATFDSCLKGFYPPA